MRCSGLVAEITEAVLVRAQRGESAACRELVRCYERPVFSFVARMLQPAHRASFTEDVAQETFLRVFRSLKNVSPQHSSPLSRWIMTIAANLAIDELCRNRPEQPSPNARDFLELGGRGPSKEDQERREIAL